MKDKVHVVIDVHVVALNDSPERDGEGQEKGFIGGHCYATLPALCENMRTTHLCVYVCMFAYVRREGVDSVMLALHNSMQSLAFSSSLDLDRYYFDICSTYTERHVIL